MGGGTGGGVWPTLRTFAKKTNTSPAGSQPTVIVPCQAFAGPKHAHTRVTCFQQRQRAEAVRVAKACIDRALAEAEAWMPPGNGVYLEQHWDAQPQWGCSVSQVLVEREGRSAEELVPQEFHEFLDVFDKQRLERLPQHRPHDLKIDLLEGAEVPPPGKLYQLTLAELRAL